MKKVILLVSFSLIVLFFILQQWIGLSEIFSAMLSINFMLLPLIIAMPFAALFMYSLRWRMLLQSVDVEAKHRVVFKYTLIGAVFNNLTPMVRFGGEPVKGYMLANQMSVPKKRVFASLAMDSVITVMTLMLLAYFGSMSLLMLNIIDVFMLWVILTLLLLPITTGSYVLYNKKLLVKATKKFSPVIERFSPNSTKNLVEDIVSFRESIGRSLKRKKILAKSLFVGTGERILEVGCFYLILLSFGVETTPFSAAVVIGVGVLAGLIPIFPGGVVTYEYFTILALGFIGVPFVTATGAVLIWRFVNYWLVIFVGLGLGSFYGVRFARGKGF